MQPQPTTAQKALTLKPKASASLLAGYVSVIFFYMLQTIWNVEAPTEVVAAVTGLVAFGAAWFAPTAVE